MSNSRINFLKLSPLQLVFVGFAQWGYANTGKAPGVWVLKKIRCDGKIQRVGNILLTNSPEFLEIKENKFLSLKLSLKNKANSLCVMRKKTGELIVDKSDSEGVLKILNTKDSARDTWAGFSNCGSQEMVRIKTENPNLNWKIKGDFLQVQISNTENLQTKCGNQELLFSKFGSSILDYVKNRESNKDYVEEAFDKVIEGNSKRNDSARFLKSWYLLSIGNLYSAKIELRRIVERNPKHGGARELLSRMADWELPKNPDRGFLIKDYLRKQGAALWLPTPIYDYSKGKTKTDVAKGPKTISVEMSDEVEAIFLAASVYRRFGRNDLAIQLLETQNGKESDPWIASRLAALYLETDRRNELKDLIDKRKASSSDSSQLKLLAQSLEGPQPAKGIQNKISKLEVLNKYAEAEAALIATELTQ